MFQSSRIASGNCSPAGLERLLAVLGFDDLEFEPFENAPRHLADDAGVVNDQTGFHRTASFCSCAQLVRSVSDRVTPRLP